MVLGDTWSRGSGGPGPCLRTAAYSLMPLAAFGSRGSWPLPSCWVDSSIRAEPEPYVPDLWYMQQQACGLLIAGENPYAALYPNIYPEEGHAPAAPPSA